MSVLAPCICLSAPVLRLLEGRTDIIETLYQCGLGEFPQNPHIQAFLRRLRNG